MKSMMNRLRGWIDGHWWTLGVLLLGFAIVVKTSTVTAPIEASTGLDLGLRAGAPSFMPEASDIALARDRATERIQSLEAQLHLEREKSELLQNNVESLRMSFDEISVLADTLIERIQEPNGLAPMPIEALYVRDGR